jgi:hypothetical protein
MPGFDYGFYIMKCTWLNCTAEAIVPQKANDGSTWANLCLEHHQEIENCMTKFEQPEYGPKRMLSSWVKAQGGAKAAAARMMNI